VSNARLAVDLPRYHRLKGALYRLEGIACRLWGARYCPSRRRCLKCGARALDGVSMKRTGILMSYTEVFNIPEGFGRESYLLGLVRLDDGANVVGSSPTSQRVS
jgi:uncharacterized OB-fold protein